MSGMLSKPLCTDGSLAHVWSVQQSNGETSLAVCQICGAAWIFVDRLRHPFHARLLPRAEIRLSLSPKRARVVHRRDVRYE